MRHGVYKAIHAGYFAALVCVALWLDACCSLGGGIGGLGGTVSRETRSAFLLQFALENAHRYTCVHKRPTQLSLHAGFCAVRPAPRSSNVVFQQRQVVDRRARTAGNTPRVAATHGPLSRSRGTRKQTSPVQAITYILLSRSTSFIGALRSSLWLLPSSLFVPIRARRDSCGQPALTRGMD